MHILALCGSLRPQSTTLKAIQIAAEEIRLAGAECHIVSGKDMNLPLCWLTEEDRQHALVLRLQELAMEADGFLLASPEYHGNMSGVLKNALDWLGAEHFEGKPSALIAVAGGSQGAQSALSSLRTTIRCRLVTMSAFMKTLLAFTPMLQVTDSRLSGSNLCSPKICHGPKEVSNHLMEPWLATGNNKTGSWTGKFQFLLIHREW